MSVVGNIFMRQLNKYCKISFVQFLIEKRFVIDHNFSVSEQMLLRDLLEQTVDNRCYFSFAVSDIIINICEVADYLNKPFFFLEFVLLVIEEVKGFLTNDIEINNCICVPLEYHKLVSLHHVITERTDDLPTLTSLSPVSPSSDCTDIIEDVEGILN